MPSRSLSLIPRHALAAACAALLAGGAWAQTATHGSGAPNGTASVSFGFDFGTGMAIDAMVFSLDWDATLLTLVGTTVEFNGNPVDDLAAVLAASGDFRAIDNSNSGNIGASWYALDANMDPLPPLDLAGNGTLSFQFMLAPTFTVPGASTVSLGLLLSSGSTTPIDLSASASIHAVPEPQSWALLLAGGAGIAAWTRRRSRV